MRLHESRLDVSLKLFKVPALAKQSDSLQVATRPQESSKWQTSH